MAEPAVSDHVRPTDDALEDGVYRVVGVDDETVTLLRVGDADGRRVYTGDVTTVSRESYASFADAENPDGNRAVGVRLSSAVESGYWMVRAYLTTLRSRPLATALSLAVLAAGTFGNRVVDGPAAAFDALVFAGAIGLALVGAGLLPHHT